MSTQVSWNFSFLWTKFLTVCKLKPYVGEKHSDKQLVWFPTYRILSFKNRFLCTAIAMNTALNGCVLAICQHLKRGAIMFKWCFFFPQRWQNSRLCEWVRDVTKYKPLLRGTIFIYLELIYEYFSIPLCLPQWVRRNWSTATRLHSHGTTRGTHTYLSEDYVSAVHLL